MDRFRDNLPSLFDNFLWDMSDMGLKHGKLLAGHFTPRLRTISISRLGNTNVPNLFTSTLRSIFRARPTLSIGVGKSMSTLCCTRSSTRCWGDWWSFRLRWRSLMIRWRFCGGFSPAHLPVIKVFSLAVILWRCCYDCMIFGYYVLPLLRRVGRRIFRCSHLPSRFTEDGNFIITSVRLKLSHQIVFHVYQAKLLWYLKAKELIWTARRKPIRSPPISSPLFWLPRNRSKVPWRHFPAPKRCGL